MEQKREVLETAIEYIDKLTAGIETCTHFYRIGDLGNAAQYIMQIINGLEWVIEVINGTQDLRAEAIATDTIHDLLREIVEAMENGDTTLIADLLEYEITEYVTSWQAQMKQDLGQ